MKTTCERLSQGVVDRWAKNGTVGGVTGEGRGQGPPLRESCKRGGGEVPESI